MSFGETIRGVVKKIPGASKMYRSFVSTPGSFLFHMGNIQWFQRGELLAQLPPLYKAFAGYCRVLSRPDGRVIGAETVHRFLSTVTRTLALRDTAELPVNEYKVWVLLTDPRSLAIPSEIASSPESALLETYLSPGDSFIDVGANHGSYSIVASRLVGASGRVVAIEPQPRLADLVSRSLKANGFCPFEVHNIACSDHDGEATFFIPRSTSGAGGLLKEFSAVSAADAVQVPLARFDHTVEWKNLPGGMFIKLDVEGSEVPFLLGARDALMTRKPPLLIEINPNSMRVAGTSGSALVQVLADLGYRYFREIRDPTLVPLNTIDCSRQRNIVAFFDLPAGSS